MHRLVRRTPRERYFSCGASSFSSRNKARPRLVPRAQPGSIAPPSGIAAKARAFQGAGSSLDAGTGAWYGFGHVPKGGLSVSPHVPNADACGEGRHGARYVGSKIVSCFQRPSSNVARGAFLSSLSHLTRRLEA